ncbi:dolichol-phosphate mannosyltransferase subunit 3 [Vararia minispora EC-137]|uniref:Dolichol-phosphate mannosyltransferase subunit 3 n=1 Tax=Vararia minispora EC-137 TaxID=1314806 RepID=A0ACB8QU18_9AGAM|nr:dolichol-phosphate mannosyltransferase subunit 3 [Vararia minispora EC-137]
MTRGIRVAAWAGILSVIYLLALFSYIPVPLLTEEQTEQVLPVIPWWLLVSFGSFALWSMGHGLYSYRDADQAYTELLAEISQAKAELRDKGVSVD